MFTHSTVEILTSGRGTRDITTGVQDVVHQSGVSTGLVHLFLQHTSGL
jgi:thiamine phosphate synthase YjbQ (UPF0047 family)